MWSRMYDTLLEDVVSIYVKIGALTTQDAVALHDDHGYEFSINDGKVVGFEIVR